MEIKNSMMFLEMARFWRRVFFWFCFILFKCQVVGRFQAFIKKSKLNVAKPNNTHHTILFVASCIAVERYQKQS